MSKGRRFLQYELVGTLGLAVKFSVLVALVEAIRAGYLLATALAVEAVILHNFAWHLRWTWRDRNAGLARREVLARLLRFQLSTGAVALVTNLAVMRLLVEGLGIHYFAANLAATGCAGLVNFMLSELWVFRPSCRT